MSHVSAVDVALHVAAAVVVTAGGVMVAYIGVLDCSLLWVVRDGAGSRPVQLFDRSGGSFRASGLCYLSRSACAWRFVSYVFVFITVESAVPLPASVDVVVAVIVGVLHLCTPACSQPVRLLPVLAFLWMLRLLRGLLRIKT